MRSSSEKDEKFFIDQPFNFKENPTWRIFRIMAEFTEGFEFLAPLRKEVTIFGSARLNNKDRWYHQAEKLGRLLGENGYTVITGGGPGIMEAGNKGATESGGESIGLDIELPMEQRRNKWVKKGIGFHYFFTRKMMLSASAQAYIFFPGGFGTLDEFFELVTLIQTNKMEKVAMVCVGKDYWEPLMSWIRIQLAEKYKTISLEDMDIFRLVDTADEAFEIIKTTKERKYF
ncbi:TIGR00730 family Rossman fold protein [Patescibacteria group bacterium]|nr:TIGR00730 family Rossman fold protein [Patescibacteria group bacterium]